MAEQRKPLLDEEGKPVLLFGRPVYMTETLPALKTGDIVLTDPQLLIDDYDQRIKEARKRIAELN